MFFLTVNLNKAQNLTLNIFLLHTEVAKTNRFQVMAILLQLSQPQKIVIFLHSRHPPEIFFVINFQKIDENILAYLCMEVINAI